MWKTVRAIALLTPITLTSIAFPARTPAQVVNISPLQTNLQAAVCQNDWEQSLQAVNQLLGSSGISDAYRQELLVFRVQLEGWRSGDAEFVNFPGCEGVIPVTAPFTYQPPGRPLDWQRAVESLDMMRSQ